VLKIKMMFSVQILPCQILIQHRLNEKQNFFLKYSFFAGRSICISSI
jgi:hypothetical protein